VHELSIAMSLVELAAERAGPLGAGARVEVVYLRLGALAGVAEEALRFSFDAACRGTALQGARLVIEHVPVAVFCARCRDARVVEGWPVRCPVCGEPAVDVVHGRELELTALEVSGDDPADR
jgi:hydrogenase nickel incorporation protein HypA/HybF